MSEQDFVQRVLRAYNRAHGVAFAVTGKAEAVYPNLLGQGNWDWVCRDSQSRELAIEVKQLTLSAEEKAQVAVSGLSEDLQPRLVDKLPGFFNFSWDVPDGGQLRFRQHERHDLLNLLEETALRLCAEAAQATCDIQESLKQGDPLARFMPVGTVLTAYKIDPSLLHPKPIYKGAIFVDSSRAWTADTERLSSDKRSELVRHVKKANCQLKLARQTRNMHQTIMVR
ncbi:MAG: hypothetical protein Q7T26_12405 [Dehalococcoidia bacterium]|nr:hypothetical protein [Dehalococcoidia bacterium]